MNSSHDPAMALFLSETEVQPPLLLTALTIGLAAGLMAMLSLGFFG